MTKPVYFPHTYMSPAAAAAIRSVFPAVAGYEPVAGLRTPDMQALVESGFLEMVAAVPDDDGRLERALREFERWGRLQQGGAGLLSVFLSRQPGWDPLAADGTVTQIACEVRRRPSEAPPAAPETLRRTAVFLQLAHQADRQTFQVNTELQGCDRSATGPIPCAGKGFASGAAGRRLGPTVSASALRRTGVRYGESGGGRAAGGKMPCGAADRPPGAGSNGRRGRGFGTVVGRGSHGPAGDAGVLAPAGCGRFRCGRPRRRPGLRGPRPAARAAVRAPGGERGGF